MTHKTLLSRNPSFVAFIVLFAQNLMIFWDHYLGKAYFPFDFTLAYYAMPAFWTTAIRAGIFPQWMPFQSLGYPFLAGLQSGLYYPPFWIFTLSDYFPYSTQAAITLQGLHLGFGAVGFYLFSKLFLKNGQIALLGALAFQFFGGFYSNAEHPDIVRAFSWIPWLFLVTQLDLENARLRFRNYFAPLVIFCFITASYPGNLISQFAFLIGIRFLEFISQPKFKGKVLKVWGFLLAFIAIGVALASVYLIPVAFAKAYLSRSTEFSVLNKLGWGIKYWPTLFMVWTNEGYCSDPAMTSAFVTVPIVCFWGLIQTQSIKKYWIWILGLLLSVSMAAGSNSFVYQGLTTLFPFLSYSRFPTSDYRGLIGFFFIFLAILFLNQLLQNLKKPNYLGLRLSSIPLLILMGYLTHLFPVLHIPREFIWTSLLFLLTHLTLTFLWKNTKIIIPLLGVFVLASGFYVITLSSHTWNHPGNLNKNYLETLHVDTRNLPIALFLKNPPAMRKARESASYGSTFSMGGYLTGNFLLAGNDTTNIVQKDALNSPISSQFMEKPWTPVLITNNSDFGCNDFIQKKQAKDIQVEQISYGVNEVRYRVQAASAFSLIENEISFPGWQGRVNENSTNLIFAQTTCGGLRTWNLPSGEYVFSTKFIMPGFQNGLIISALALLFYLGLLGIFLKTQFKFSFTRLFF